MKPFLPSVNLLATFSFIAALALPARADLLELTNGDHYRGTVISMTASNVEFQSEIQGRVTLPRSKIATITFNEVIGRPVKAITNTALIIGNASSATNVPHSVSVTTTGTSAQANPVIEQLRQQGVAPKLIEQVQEQIFGKASPEAAQKFDELMGGLMTGRYNVEDIRKQAQASIAQIRTAKKDLGGDAGDMLDSYLVILEKFVNEAGNDTTVSAAKTPPTTIPVK